MFQQVHMQALWPSFFCTSPKKVKKSALVSNESGKISNTDVIINSCSLQYKVQWVRSVPLNKWTNDRTILYMYSCNPTGAACDSLLPYNQFPEHPIICFLFITISPSRASLLLFTIIAIDDIRFYLVMTMSFLTTQKF